MEFSEAFQSPDTAKFFLEAKAVPAVEQDPFFFGLLHAVYEFSKTEGRSPKVMDKLAGNIAEFSMERFMDFLNASPSKMEIQIRNNLCPEDAYLVENKVYEAGKAYFSKLIYTEAPNKDASAFKKVRCALYSDSFGCMMESLEKFFRDKPQKLST